ncbi:O-antigen ligase family protein [Ktedonosporobacter rubrisoli]|uniref:O-antigen ligase family protein n=1 Tax=Ktedonosporobacter rubrisoli TaxID=2509675 RepID=A0A4V0YYX9_KTERU|nr:O-antigen ligase family protein [Ktedonosporobacter rubrisoli]QBD77781.1 O-antigen ligase family protein [Ktedonosporobacter rubrisoli]
MNSQNIPFSVPDAVTNARNAKSPFVAAPHSPLPPTGSGEDKTSQAYFWRDRFFEGALILSMALYYIIGNTHLTIVGLSQLNALVPASLLPLISLPFLLIFALLCWYRLNFAIALLPLSLPYYLLQKNVIGRAEFSLAEITLGVCCAIAVLRLALLFFTKQSRPFWSQLRDGLGPFVLPILVFALVAAISIIPAYSRANALRAFREEVFDPLLYVGLALLFLRSRQDVTRLLGSLLGTGLIIALLGMAQYFFFKNTLALEDGIRRVHTVYGSANSIGLLFDYVLPIGLAMLLGRVALSQRFLALLLCVPMLLVLYLTQSLGAWLAISVATLFVIAMSIRNRKILLAGGLLCLVLVIVGVFIFRSSILGHLFEWHTNQHGVSTVTKRLYLWQSALNMIHDSPWLGYGMDNWLCHYSLNLDCHTTIYHYWLVKDPITHLPTGLHDEPNLSHPHNIFLHVWVSMGVFGLLAFISVLLLFYWLFGRVLSRLNSTVAPVNEQLRWMAVGVGGRCWRPCSRVRLIARF